MENLFTQIIYIFNWIIRASVYAIVSISIIAMVQFAGRRWLPARWMYAFWLILLVRMVLPFGPESRWSMWNFLPQAVHEDGLTHIVPFFEVSLATSPLISNAGDGVASWSPAIEGELEEHAMPLVESRGVNPLAALSAVWLAGSLVMIAVVAVNNLQLWRSVRKLRQVTDQSLLELFEDCKQLIRVSTVVGLVITDQVKSPSLFGCFRPRVLLPVDLVGQTSREELRFIFLHELAHLKQRDIWIGWIVALLQSLHWFNPLVWWAFARMRADREVACDALALSRIENEDGERYGGALIGLLKRFHHSRRLPVVAGILENKTQLKRRLTMITYFKRSTRRETIAAVALLALMSITLLTSPQILLSQPDGVIATDLKAEEAVAAARTALGGVDKIDGIESLVIKGKVIRAIFSSSTQSKNPGVMMKTDTFAYDTEIRILLPDNFLQIDIRPARDRGLLNDFIPSTKSTTAYSGISQGKLLGPPSVQVFGSGGVVQPDAETLARRQANDVRNQTDEWSRFMIGILAKSGPVQLTLLPSATPGVFNVEKQDEVLGEVEFDSKTGYPSLVRWKTPGPPPLNISGNLETFLAEWSNDPENMVDGEIRFRDHFSVDGVMFPRVVQWLIPGRRDMELWIEEVQINPNLSLEDFQAPE